jgi:DNA mismatch repair ATPase MutS
VPARSFAAGLRDGIFTHFKREEDAALRHGKFVEELARIRGIVDRLSPDSMVLCNESAQSTNEREGSEIGRPIVEAFLESGIKVIFVTHMHDLARSLHDRKYKDGVFLRAERLADGTRTFRMVPGPPLSTSHGRDVFREVFRISGGGGRAFVEDATGRCGRTAPARVAASDPG